MSLEESLNLFVDYVGRWAPAFALVLARVAGIFLMAPLLGSSRVPRRVRALLILMLALGMAGAVPAPPRLPEDLATLTIALGGEIAFGLAMGMIISFVFIAAQWAGEIMGQQMGLSLAQTFDPQFGSSSSLVGDLHFMLTLVIFMSPLVNGPAQLLRGVHASFAALPLLSVGLDRALFETLVDLFSASAMLAVQLAAPMLVTILIVDIALGIIGKTMPQLNIMTAGLSLRALVGMVVLVFGIRTAGDVLNDAVIVNVERVQELYATARTEG
ncbi:MAG: flagellar biosynthetic protein FliR [Phycisphaerales bacterium]|nr:flagellar biosynthetic protein FliR [Phycisphaerales bacterium]